MLFLLNPRMIKKRPGQVNQEVSQEDRSVCKDAQVEPQWVGQSCGGGGGRTAAGTVGSLHSKVTEVNGEIRETGGRDAFLHCKRGLAGTQTGGEEPSRGHRLVAGTVVSSAFPCPPSPMQVPFSSSPPTKTPMPQTIAYLFTDGM